LQITQIMEVPLEGRKSKALLLVVVLAVSGTLIWQAGRFWLARHLADSGQIAQLEKSAALVPGNGAVWDQLGRLHQWDLADADLSLALADFRRAVSVDPLSARSWMDLAVALYD
jgi:cytochrome c-type biogenesis protein CcmH/NrfG